MKVEFKPSGFRFEAEDGRDTVWLADFLKSIPPVFRPILSEFIEVDMEDWCVHSKEDNTPMHHVPIEEVFSKTPKDLKALEGFPWGPIQAIEFTAYGIGGMNEKAFKKSIKKLHDGN